MGPQAQFEHGSVTIALPDRQVLSQDEQGTVVAAPGTRLRLVLNAIEVRFTATPPLRVLVHAFDLGWATEDVEIVSGRYRLDIRKAEVEVRRVPTWELNLASGAVRRRAEELMARYFEGVDVAGLMAKGGHGLATQSPAGMDLPPAFESAQITQGRITISAREALQFRRGAVSARLPEGAHVTFDAKTQGSVDLFRISSVLVTAKPPLEVSDGTNTIAVSALHVQPSLQGVIVRAEARDIRFVTRGSGPSAVVGAFALFGMLGGSARRLPPAYVERQVQQAMTTGDRATRELATGTLDEAFTSAVGLMLEEARPQLKRQAPFIDWDGLLQKQSRRPALPRPVHHGP